VELIPVQVPALLPEQSKVLTPPVEVTARLEDAPPKGIMHWYVPGLEAVNPTRSQADDPLMQPNIWPDGVSTATKNGVL